MDDFGRYLFLIAIVVIGAIRWVFQQIQERNNPPQEEDPLEDTWKELEEHHERQSREQPRPEPTVSPANDLKSLFESLRQKEQPKPQEPPRRPVAPAPAPAVRRPQQTEVAKTPADPRDKLSAAERAALKNLSGRGAAPLKHSKKQKVSHGGFRDLLYGAGNLRKALILKEVFDKPLALRAEEDGTIRG